MGRQDVQTIIPQRQRINPQYSRGQKRAVKMGEKLAAARRFPFQGIATGPRFHGQQQQACLAGAMAGGTFRQLGCGGKMDEAIRLILGGAIIATGSLGCLPFLGTTHVKDGVSHFVQSGGAVRM
jgi:hypothetical protein